MYANFVVLYQEFSAVQGSDVTMHRFHSFTFMKHNLLLTEVMSLYIAFIELINVQCTNNQHRTYRFIFSVYFLILKFLVLV